jgi:hypothetical protein
MNSPTIIVNPDFEELESARLKAMKLCEEANTWLK